MNRQGIFERLQTIVAQELSINKECINEKTRLFEVKFVDRRYGLKDKHVVNFNSEESQYYSCKISMCLGDTCNATNVLMALEEEFEIEIPDEITSQLTTIGRAIDYISAVVAD